VRWDEPSKKETTVSYFAGEKKSWRQPQAEPLDLSQPDEALLEKILATP
jgi:hypothetical protein